MFREEQPALGELFLYLNQKRDVVAQTASAPFLLSLPPEGWSIFRQAAPDFWSIHTSVYRFSGAEIRREERMREASEEAFVWQAFAEFVALRLLRAVIPPHSPRKRSWPPPARDGLIGRQSEKRTLRTWLTQPGARILVQGLGGTGKTSLLRDVMEEMPRSYPDGIFFFSLRDGGEVPRIMEEVVEALRPGLLAPLLRRNVLQAMFRDVTAESRVLLVFDDAEDLEALERLAPSPPSAVLAAGRAGPPPDGWRRLSLDLLGTRESIELLQRISPGLSKATVRSLAGKAGGHLLQLQILGGLAGASSHGFDRWMESSNRIVEVAGVQLTSDLKEAWGGAAVFQASFGTERFQAVAGLASVELATECLQDLASRRLLDHSEEGSWSMHPLLRYAALELLGGEAAEALRRKHAAYHLKLLAGKREEWTDFLPDVEEALRWLDASGGYSVPGGGFGGQPQDYLQHLTGKWASVWLDATARSAVEGGNGGLATAAYGWSALACVQEGDVEGARKRFAGARTLARESGRPDLEAIVLRNQAAFAFWTGHLDETSGLARETLRLTPTGWTRGDLIILAILATVSLDEDSVEQVNELNSWAEGAESSLPSALRILVGSTLVGRFADEDSTLERVQKDLETVSEPEWNPASDLGIRAWALALRAELHLRQEDHRVALESAESAVRQAHGAYDWEAESEALRVLGQIQEAVGDVAGAESSHSRLLKLREQLYSADHEGVAWAARDLARVLETMARYSEAEISYRRAVDIFGRSRPGTDRALAATLFEWGRLLLRMARLSEAETLLREALAASLSSLGPAHLNSVSILGMLAYLALEAGRLDEAEDLLRSVLAIQEHSYASQTPAGRRILGQHLRLLAHILAARGQVGDALAVLWDRTLPIFEEIGDFRARAFTLGQIADLLASEKRYDEALPPLQESLALLSELGDVRGRATALGQIASLFAAQKRYDEALSLAREQLSILQRLGDRQATESAQKTLQTYEADSVARGSATPPSTPKGKKPRVGRQQ